MDYKSVLDEVLKFSRRKLDVAETEDSTIYVAKNLIFALKEEISDKQREGFDQLTFESVRHLKIMCTKGASFQNLIINTTGMLTLFKKVLSGESNVAGNQIIKFFQLIANLCVGNTLSQEKIWMSLRELIIEKFKSNDFTYINVGAMIIHSMILSGIPHLDHTQITVDSLEHYENFLKFPENSLPDFVNILLEHLICKGHLSVDIYEQLSPKHQKTALFYIHDFIEDESNETIDSALIQNLTSQFKTKSDCILKTVSTYVDTIDPEIVVSLLDVISIATPQEKYLKILKDDRSLFLNLGCLLQALHKIGKSPETIFTPIQKLEALVPTSNANGDFEKDISYSMKTKLVKSLANLSYKNRKNQELAREMEIMISLFECTLQDARNPLIKEWSILAIKNLCDNNIENQEIVRGLTKVGNAENPLLKEMGLENGMLRIGK